MKIKLLFICACLFTIKAYTQDTIVNYYDKTKKITDKNFAYTIQQVIKKDSIWQENVYYFKSKSIKSIGQYLDQYLKNKVGEFQYYDSNGKISSIVSYNKTGQLHGKYLGFKMDKKSVVGIYKNGKKNGLWNYYEVNGNKIARIIYNKDKVHKYDLWNKNGEKINEPLIFERRAEYVGGIKNFYKKIKKDLAPLLKKLKVPFKLYVMFTVDANGSIKNVKMNTYPSMKHKEIIEDFFYKLPKWKPAIQLNRPVDVKFTVPLKLGK